MLEYNSTTTLNRIREGSPESGRACEEGYAKLLKGLGKTRADDEPVTLLQVIGINGLDDALWVLSYAMPDDRLARHFQAWCADQVVHLFEEEFPGDMRVRDHIAMLRNDNATPEERATARTDAWNVGWTAGLTAGWAAARAAAAIAAARAAARDARAAAAWVAAWDTARAKQEEQLRKMLAQEKAT